MSDDQNLNAELHRLLTIAQEVSPAPFSFPEQQLPRTLTAVWPWQVPQMPTYTSNNAGANREAQ